MSEFDDMLKAGVISPGSTPFVEGKRAPTRDHPEVTAKVTIVSEARASGPTEREGDEDDWAPRWTALVVTADVNVGLGIRDALAGECHCILTTDATSLGHGLRFDVVVADGRGGNLDRLRALAPALLVLDGPDRTPDRLIDQVRAVLHPPRQVEAGPEPAPRVIILTPDPALASALSYDLSSFARPAVSRFLLSRGAPELVATRLLIVDAAYPDLSEVLAIDLPIVVLTAEEDRARAIEAIGDRDIPKLLLPLPADRTEVLRRIRSMLA